MTKKQNSTTLIQASLPKIQQPKSLFSVHFPFVTLAFDYRSLSEMSNKTICYICCQIVNLTRINLLCTRMAERFVQHEIWWPVPTFSLHSEFMLSPHCRRNMRVVGFIFEAERLTKKTSKLAPWTVASKTLISFLFFAAYLICKNYYSFSQVVFLFFQTKIANSISSKINDICRLRTTRFSSSRLGVRVTVVPNIFTIFSDTRN